MIKWLLRYDQKRFYKFADLSNARSLVSAIHNYQAQVVCAQWEQDLPRRVQDVLVET